MEFRRYGSSVGKFFQVGHQKESGVDETPNGVLLFLEDWNKHSNAAECRGLFLILERNWKFLVPPSCFMNWQIHTGVTFMLLSTTSVGI